MTLTKLLIAGAAIFTLAACEKPQHEAAAMSDGSAMMEDGTAMMDDGSTKSN